MSQAETIFKAAVLILVSKGIYPGPVQIRRQLGRGSGSQTINARQMRWRAEVLELLGWAYKFDVKKRHAWTPPASWQGKMT